MQLFGDNLIAQLQPDAVEQVNLLGCEAWRAEVGPMLPGGRPRTLPFEFEVVLSFECFVFLGIGDCTLICLKAHVECALE